MNPSSTDRVFEEIDAGFQMILDVLGKDKTRLKETTLDAFALEVVQSENVMFNELIGHLFWDRMHMTGLFLHKRPEIIFSDGPCSIQKIFFKIAEKAPQNPHASQQIRVRLQLVDNYCREYFPFFYSSFHVEDDEAFFAYFTLKNILHDFQHHIDNQLWTHIDPPFYYHACIPYLEEVLSRYETREGYCSIKECMEKARLTHEEAYVSVYKEIYKRDNSNEFFLKALATEKSLTAPAAPPQESEKSSAYNALTHFNVLIRLLINKPKKVICSLNVLDELELIIDGAFFNVTQILKGKPCLAQMHLSKEELCIYYASVKGEVYEKFPEIKLEKNRNKLHIGQKAALLFYSSSSYCKSIQRFARNYGATSLSKEWVIKILLIMGVAGSASDMSPKKRMTTYRWEELSDKQIQARINTINKPMVQPGFYSTSESIGIQRVGNSVNVCYKSDACPEGISIKNFSVCEEEEEITYPPGTWLCVLDYWELKRNNQYFHIFSLAILPTLGNEYSTYSMLNMFWHEITIVKEMLINRSNSLLSKYGFYSDKSRALKETLPALTNLLDQEKLTISRMDIDILKKCREELFQEKNHSRMLHHCYERLSRSLSLFEEMDYNKSIDNEQSSESSQFTH